jgi:muramoyltetrapeptide carboxypeptidase
VSAALPAGSRGAWRFPLCKPPALGPGARLAVVAPASAFDVSAFHAGLAELTALGFEGVYDESVFARDRYLAGAPAVRAAALARAWQDPSIGGIIAVRGGYGSVHLLPLLDPDWPRRHPKVLIGYSDITSLHVWLGQLGQVTFQGPMIEGRLARGVARYDRDALVRAVTSATPLGELGAPQLETLVPGEAAGPLFGGTLTQLAASLGTPFAFDPPHGCVLFLEDVAERPYKLDRLVTQLRLAGILARAAAIVLGTFPDCDEPGGDPTARATLASLLGGFPGPVVFGLPVGHVDGPALTLPLGVSARVIGGATPRVIIEEAAVA